MLRYNSNLKDKARELRKNLTDSEALFGHVCEINSFQASSFIGRNPSVNPLWISTRQGQNWWLKWMGLSMDKAIMLKKTRVVMSI